MFKRMFISAMMIGAAFMLFSAESHAALSIKLEAIDALTGGQVIASTREVRLLARMHGTYSNVNSKQESRVDVMSLNEIIVSPTTGSGVYPRIEIHGETFNKYLGGENDIENGERVFLIADFKIIYPAGYTNTKGIIITTDFNIRDSFNSFKTNLVSASQIISFANANIYQCTK